MNWKPRSCNCSGLQFGSHSFMAIRWPISGRYTTAHSFKKSGKSLAANLAAAVTSLAMSCWRNFSEKKIDYFKTF